MRSTCGAWLIALVSWTVATGAAGETRLVDAARAGNRAAVRSLISQRVPVDSPEADGTTALHWVVRADDIEMVRLLLRAEASPKAANRYGVTPLSLAAVNGNLAIVEALLKAGADPNARMEEDQTILMAAARTGHAGVVKALVAHGADVNARDRVLGETALIYAAFENHPAAVAVLAANGADLNLRSRVTTFPKFKFGDGIVARTTILPRGGWTAMMYAARQGAGAAARALADAGADMNLTDPDGTNALMLAIINAHFDVAGILIDKGADPNVPDRTGMAALYAAVDMHTLPETVGRPNPKPRGTLDSPDIIKLLLAHGANVNQRLTAPTLDRVHNDGNSDASLGDGATPLMRAAKQADVPVMRLLLDQGADPGLANRKGMTPVLYAAGRASGGRNANAQASAQDVIDAIALCLERGADLNAADDTGQTALHLAAASAEESDRILAFLAGKGANPLLKDQRGRTPLDAALAGGGRGGQAAGRERKVAFLRQLTANARPATAGAPASNPTR
jgi:ankyrin repeat protein